MDIVIMTLLYVEAFRQLGKKEQKIIKKNKTLTGKSWTADLLNVFSATEYSQQN